MSDALLLERSGKVLTLRLNRPEVRNAFDAALIAQLTAALQQAGTDPKVKVVVLAGAGPAFSAGADLQWMRSMASASEAENLADALALAQLMRTLDELPKPTVARVHGATFGGAVGLVACCDIAVAATDARFEPAPKRSTRPPPPRSAWCTRRWRRPRWTRRCSARWNCSARPARSPPPAPRRWCAGSPRAATAPRWTATTPR